MKTDPHLIERAARLQEDFQSWLLLTHPFARIEVIITALTYEIARIVGQHMPADVDIDTVLAGITTVMKEQIKAHRAGTLPP